MRAVAELTSAAVFGGSPLIIAMLLTNNPGSVDWG
jgi:hypothetical protein